MLPNKQSSLKEMYMYSRKKCLLESAKVSGLRKIWLFYLVLFSIVDVLEIIGGSHAGIQLLSKLKMVYDMLGLQNKTGLEYIGCYIL